jgi:hypothetical protein
MILAARATGHRLALDRASVRTFDADGRLHVSIANISKANVCGYLGREIPDFEKLGLNPDQLYQLLRPADELANAASTFNNLPLLSQHVPVDARDHRPDLVVGSLGSECKFVAPYLQNSLIVWAQSAIDGIVSVSGAKRQLSAAYRYRAVMEAGNFQGQRYDGRMVEIVGNHEAIVVEGRAGPDVAVDQALPRHITTAAVARSLAERFPHAAKIRVNA